MTRMQTIFFTVTFLFLSTASTQAQSVSTFVSAKNGNDSGTCTLAQPCRNLTYAQTQTAAGGVVTIIDSGTYTPTNVIKAMTIQAAPGVEALIISTSGNGISINTGTANFVTLRGLIIEGSGTSNFGIQSSNTGGVQIENCQVKNYLSAGIQLTGNAGKHSIVNTAVQHCANGIIVAITVGTFSTATALIENCRIEKSTNIGISIAANGSNNKTRGVLRNTTSIGNGSHGFSGSGNTGGASDLIIENCISANNGTGISGTSGSTLRISNSIVSGNNLGIGGTALTRQNNSVEYNNTEGSFSGTFTAK